MVLTAKVASYRRNRTIEGDDTLNSGFPQAQTYRSSGAAVGYQVGSNTLIKAATVDYDFATDGPLLAGNIGTGVYLPANAIPDDVIIDVIIVPVGPANIGLSLENDNDLLASKAVSGAPWSSANAVFKGDINFGGDEGTGRIKTTVPREIMLNPDAPFTAGRFVVIVSYHASRL